MTNFENSLRRRILPLWPTYEHIHSISAEWGFKSLPSPSERVDWDHSRSSRESLIKIYNGIDVDGKTNSRVHWIVKLMRWLCNGTWARKAGCDWGRRTSNAHPRPDVHLPLAAFPFAPIDPTTEGCGSGLQATWTAKKFSAIIFARWQQPSDLMDRCQLSSKVDCEIFIKIGNPSAINCGAWHHNSPSSLNWQTKEMFLSRRRERVARYRLLTNLTIIEKLCSECQSEWKKAERKGCQFLIKIPEFLAFTFYSISLFPSNCFHHSGVYHIWHKFSPSHFLLNVDLFAFQLPIRLFSRMAKEKTVNIAITTELLTPPSSDIVDVVGGGVECEVWYFFRRDHSHG